MTKQQITFILDSLNESTDTLSDFPNIASIGLDNNKVIYPSASGKCLFDTSHSLLLEYTQKNNAQVLKNIYSFENIHVIYGVNKNHVKNGFNRGMYL